MTQGATPHILIGAVWAVDADETAPKKRKASKMVIRDRAHQWQAVA